MNTRKLFCEECNGAAKAECRAAGHVLKQRRRSNNNLRKRCGCGRRSWETCSHPWHFNFMLAGVGYRDSLKTSDYDEAKRRFANVEAAIRNGTYAKPKAEPAPAVDRPTFAVVAGQYAERHIKVKLVPGAQSNHGYHSSFLAGITVPPGVPFTDKPFHLITLNDIETALTAKRTPTTKVYQKGGKTWTRTVGGDVAFNRFRDYLCGLWNWAIRKGYTD